MTTATCLACHRVMRDISDFPRGNYSSDFCADCVDESGHLRPYNAIRQIMIDRRLKSGGLDLSEATELVDNLLITIPLWNSKKMQFSR